MLPQMQNLGQGFVLRRAQCHFPCRWRQYPCLCHRGPRRGVLRRHARGDPRRRTGAPDPGSVGRRGGVLPEVLQAGGQGTVLSL